MLEVNVSAAGASGCIIQIWCRCGKQHMQVHWQYPQVFTKTDFTFGQLEAFAC